MLALLLCMEFATAAAIGLFADFIAGSLLVVAMLPSSAMPEIFRKTTVEQKLILLLPGMPRGNALTQQLAKRHIVQAYVSWSVATAIAVLLPLEGIKFQIGVSGYLAILIIIPLTPTTNWAKLKPLNPESGLLALALLAAIGGGLFAAQHWGLMPVVALFVVALSVSLALLSWRWNQVKGYPQAFPVGQWS